MLDDVGDAAQIVGFIARADADPNAKRHGLHIRDVFGDNPNAVRQDFALYHSVWKTLDSKLSLVYPKQKRGREVARLVYQSHK